MEKKIRFKPSDVLDPLTEVARQVDGGPFKHSRRDLHNRMAMVSRLVRKRIWDERKLNGKHIVDANRWRIDRP